MSWTGQKLDKGIVDGKMIFVQILYTDGAEKTLESLRRFPVPADWPDSEMRQKLADLNAPQDIKAQLQSILLGDVLPAPAPIPQTPEQIAQGKWLSAHRSWVQCSKAVAQAFGKKTQGDVDALRLALEALPYLDAYEAFL